MSRRTRSMVAAAILVTLHLIAMPAAWASQTSGVSASSVQETVPDAEHPDATPQGGEPCPELTGLRDTSSHIYGRYTWVNNGCQMPIRRGFYARTGFGWEHITYRRVVNGEINHETTAFAQKLWAQALLTSGKVKPDGIFLPS